MVNFLYHWLQVFRQREDGHQCVALRLLLEMSRWFAHFPAPLRDGTITRGQVRLTDRREPPASGKDGAVSTGRSTSNGSSIHDAGHLSSLPLDAREDRSPIESW